MWMVEFVFLNPRSVEMRSSRANKFPWSFTFSMPVWAGVVPFSSSRRGVQTRKMAVVISHLIMHELMKAAGYDNDDGDDDGGKEREGKRKTEEREIERHVVGL